MTVHKLIILLRQNYEKAVFHGGHQGAFGCQGDWYVAAAESPAMSLSPWQSQSQLAVAVGSRSWSAAVGCHQGGLSFSFGAKEKN